MAHAELTTKEEIQKFLDENGGIAVVDCYANWCGPCKKIAPYVHKKNEETKIPLVSLNVDNAEEVSATYGVSGIPHFVVIKGKWNNVINAGTGGSEGVVNGIFNHALNHK